jgi:hypothetical protein
MPFPLIPLAIAGISGLAGAISNKKSARTSTSAPTIAPEFKTLSDLLRSRAEQNLRSSMDMSGIQAGGIQNINDTFGGIAQSQNNSLTARGLASSPVAATVDAGREQARGGNIADFLNTIPQMQRQFQTQDMNNASNVLRFGAGNTSVGPGSALGSGMGSAAEMLAFLKGMGQF